MAKAREKAEAQSLPPHQVERKGPYLAAALIAERILTEQDRTMSLVRIVDTISFGPEVLSTLQDNKLACPLTIVVNFKGGGYEKTASLLIVQGGPSGDSQPLGLTEIPFDGTMGRSYTVHCQVVITWEQSGFYWFDIYLDNLFFSRLILEVNVAQQPSRE